jgi:hypothetical protein
MIDLSIIICELRSAIKLSAARARKESVSDTGREVRVVVAAAFGILAGRGGVRAFRSLEKMALRADLEPDERAKLVQLLCDRALETIPRLARSRDIQEAVDVAVGVVDVSLKAGHATLLDRTFGKLDPEVLPPEIVLAFLSTSKPGAWQLPAREALVERFEKAIKRQGRADANALMRFAR